MDTSTTDPDTIPLKKYIKTKRLLGQKRLTEVARRLELEGRPFKYAFNGKVEKLTNHLQTQKDDIQLRTDKKEYLLHFAVLGNQIDIVVLLVDEFGAEVDTPDRDGMILRDLLILLGLTPFHVACMFGRVVIADFLLKAGAYVNHLDNSRVHPIMKAALLGNYKLIGLMVKHDDLKVIQSKTHNTPFHVCAVSGSKRCMVELLEAELDIDIDERESITGATALIVAARNNNFSVAKMLLDNGADVSIVDNKENSALHVACFHGHTSVVELLLSYKIVSSVNHDGNTPVHLCCEGGFLTILELLIEAGFECDTPNAEGQTPLHITTKRGHFKCVKKLISENVNLEPVDYHGYYALDYASLYKNYSLATYGADVSVMYLHPKDDDGNVSKILIPPKHKSRMLHKGKNYGNVDIDPYGFLFEDEISKMTHNSIQNEVGASKKKNVKDWNGTLESWDGNVNPKMVSKLVKKIIKTGIPNHLRSDYWKLAMRTKSMKENDENTYDFYLQAKLDRADLNQIDKDIHRTLRKHSKYETRYGLGQCELFRILRAYAVRDENCRYTQGMAHLASILHIYIDDEETVFWAFTRLMEYYQFRIWYKDNLMGLNSVALPVWDSLLADKFPTLSEHMLNFGVPSAYYLTNWILEFYYGIVPFTLLLKLYDILFLVGPSIIFSFGLAILDLNEDALMAASDFKDFSDIVRDDPIGDHEHKEILKLATKKYFIPSEEFADLVAEYS